MKPQRLIATLALVVVSVVCGCETAKNAATSLQAMSASLERLASTADTESAAWRQTVDETSKMLVKEGQSTIANELNNVVQRGIAATGVEVRCNIDFIRGRVAQDIRSLISKLNGKPVPVTSPAFCQITPDTVDLNLPSDRLTAIHLTGYDFDHSGSSGAGLRLFLEGGSGVRTDVSAWLSTSTHYAAVIALRPEVRAQLRAGRSLSLTWNGAPIGSTIPIIPPKPIVVDREVRPADMEYVPPRVRGDADFDTGDDEKIKVDLRTEARLQGNAIQVRVHMRGEEWDVKHNKPQSDFTTVDGWSDWRTVFTAGTGETIEQILTPLAHTHNLFVGRTDEGRPVPAPTFPSGELVRQYEVHGDTGGNEAGTYTNVKVYFNAIKYRLRIPPPS